MTRLWIFLAGILIFVFWLFAGQAAPTPTPVCSMISSNTTWTTAGSPYEVCNTLLQGVVVQPGVTLTIQPGVTVEFDGSAFPFTVQGSLFALGTATSPITFTGVTPAVGSWRGITVSGSPGVHAVLNLDHTNFHYGGKSQTAEIVADQADITIDHSSIQDSASMGLVILSTSTFTVRNTSFLNNAQDALNLPEPKSDMNLTGLTASGNGGANGVHISGLSTDMAGQRHWANPGIPYVVNGSIHNSAGDVLTIDPGAELDFNSSASINLGGELDALGTAAAPIVMTGVTKSPGAWIGIVADGGSLHSAAVNLDYVTVEYAGQDFGGANILVTNGYLTAHHSLIRNSAKDGVQFNISASGSVINSQVYGNGLYGVRSIPGQSILASNNWWGVASGPNPDNKSCPIGAGDKVTAGVLFLPIANAQNQTQTFPLSSYATLTVSPRRWYAPADGTTRIYFDITLRDGNGAPLAGRTVLLSSSLGNPVGGGITDVNGKTLAYLTSTAVGNATVTASLSGFTACEGALSPKAEVTFTAPVSTTDLMPDELSPYDNQDITVSPMPVNTGVPTTISARLTNPLTTPITVEVSIDFAQSGVGLVFGPIAQFKNQVIPAHSSRVFSTVWTPLVSGHYCFQVDYSITALGPLSLRRVDADSTSKRRNLNVYHSPTNNQNKDDGLKTTRNSLKAVNRFVDRAYSPNPFAVPLAVANQGIAWDLNNAEKINQALQGDPPRQDFTRIDLPAVHTLAPIQPGSGLSAARAAALNDLDAALAQANAYGTAAALAFDRSGGAAEAGNLQWESTQTGIMLEYNRQYGAALVTVAQKIDALLNQAAAEGTSSVVISIDDVTAMQLKLKNSGFSAAEIADAHALGLTDADIAAIRQNILAANPSDLAGDLIPAMRQIRDNFFSLGAVLQNPPTFAPGLAVSGGALLPQATGGNTLAQVFDLETTFVLANQTGLSETIQLIPRRVSLPADWNVTVSPSQVSLAAGSQITITVHVVPGSPVPQGIVPRLAVEATNGPSSQLLGGVVLDVSVPDYAPFDGKLRLDLPLVQR